jgi:imidazolonepropionase
MRPADTTGAQARASAFDGTLLVRAPASVWTGTTARTGVSVLVEGDRIAWIGPDADAPRADTVVDARGRILLPGLVDPHTHTVHAGTRVDEFARRLAGASYTEILEAGGGIHATVRAVRDADAPSLTRLARARLDGMLAGGVTTVEIKSGYGLTPNDEAKMLRAARDAGGPVEVVPTFLGAHARPAGRDDYVDEVVGPQLDACRDLAAGIDVYCDRGAFTLAEAERILRAGRDAGLSLRIHAEQVAYTGAAAMAASLGALSADHLERIDDAGIRAMAEAGTVAVLLPGAMLVLRDTPPPVAKLRAAGVRMAIGTDLNPGSSPIRDLLACAGLACITMGLTAEEALAGVTAHAADALGRPDLGRVEVGARADLALFAPPPGESTDPRVLVQYLGGHVATWVCKGGDTVRCASTGIG